MSGNDDEPEASDEGETDPAAARDDIDTAHSQAEVSDAAVSVLPNAEVEGVRPVDEGKNAVYFVDATTDGARRELVLKVGTRFGGPAFRAEAHLLEAVGDRTSIPVPEVVGVGEDGAPLSDPYFLAERIAGENCECEPGRLPPSTFERVAAEAGRNLAELHAAFPAEGFGLLGVEAGADGGGFTPVTSSGGSTTGRVSSKPGPSRTSSDSPAPGSRTSFRG